MLGAVIFFQRFRHPGFQLLNASTVRWMGREKFRRLRAARVFHSFPKPNAFLRIISGAGHINQADVIGFRFMFAAERH